MLELLLVACVLAVVAYVLSQVTIPPPWASVINGILLLVFIFAVFGFFGVGPGLTIR